MCKTGGVRCDSKWSSEKHAQVLARRRELYALKKSQLAHLNNGINLSHAPQDLPGDEKTVDSFGQNVTLTSIERSTQADFIGYEPDGNTVVTAKLFQEEELAGRIDLSSLHDGSYKEYGFSSPEFDQNGRYMHKGRDNFSHRQELIIDEQSKKELGRLPVDNQYALFVYTTDAYRGINGYFHGQKKAITIKNDDEDSRNPWYEGLEELRGMGNHYDGNLTPMRELIDDGVIEQEPNFDEISKSELNDYILKLDESFDAVDGRQRITYRGTVLAANNGKAFEQFVNENNVGSTIAMDGYQSTSYNQYTANYFAANDDYSVMYEILSPSGLLVSSASVSPGETEVLMPRSSKYRVVGKHISPCRTSVVLQVVEVIEDGETIRTKDNLRSSNQLPPLSS